MLQQSLNREAAQFPKSDNYFIATQKSILGTFPYDPLPLLNPRGKSSFLEGLSSTSTYPPSKMTSSFKTQNNCKALNTHLYRYQKYYTPTELQLPGKFATI